MIEKKEESDEEDEEEEEEEDDSEEKDEKTQTKKENEKKSEKISIKDKSSIKNKSKEKTEKKSELSKNNTNNINNNKKNINEKYTEQDIIENAGFKIEKTSSKKSLSEIELDKKEENPLKEKITPDRPEVRNLRVHAAKIRNEFPKWNKVPEAKGGDLAIKCWNCQNINICSSNLNVIQCPVCNEMNKVPKVMDRIDELLMLAKANTCVTYSDINHTVPLVNYIVVCPYCKCDNKVRETAYFCICYK